MTTIALLGLGAMGSRMASRLLAAGFTVRGWNRAPAPRAALRTAGGDYAESPREAVAGADLVLSVLRDDAAGRAVWMGEDEDEGKGALAGLDAETLVLECGTVTPAWVEELGTRVASRGATLLDAPLVGSRPQAEAGALVFLVGGPAAAVRRAQPVFDCLGRAHHHLGTRGQGAALKLAVNALFASQVAQMAELLRLLQASGLDAAAALAVMADLPVTSPAAAAAGGQILDAQFAPLFPIPLVAKDLDYACDLARGTGTALPLTAATAALYRQATATGLAGQNITAIARLQTTITAP